MAGSIPPLVSSSPPPLSAFDDDDEEEEDEYGVYNHVEESDYNECIEFQDKDEGKRSKGEPQDSTSQDSATDSGLCPDSGGVSPTPHSDEERTAKHNLCDRLCPKPEADQGPLCDDSQSECLESSPFNVEDHPLNLPNGHIEEEDNFADSDDDFGNFEFASTSSQKANSQDVETSEVRKPISGLTKNELTTSTENIKISEQTDVIFEEVSGQPLKSSYIGNKKYSTDDFDESKSELNNSIFISSVPEQPHTDEGQETHSANLYIVKSEIEHENCFESALNSDNCTTVKEACPQFEEEDDDFDDFTGFTANFSNSIDFHVTEHSSTHCGNVLPPTEQECSEETAKSTQISQQDDSDDEFSNFADFSSSECAFVSAQSSNSLESVPHIPPKLSEDNELRTDSEFQDWVSVFPIEDSNTSPSNGSALVGGDDAVWVRLFPLESTPALSYQWTESLANRRLLSALNIDSRNILFMAWSNTAVPRFAANLSCGPLEPTKATEPLQPTPAPVMVTSSTQESVPDAHFDWVSSGLTNPLDSSHSSLLDLNFMMTHLTISPKPVLNLPKTVSAAAESILSMLPDITYMRKTYIDFPINDV